MILNDESDVAHVYSDQDKKQFIFQLFKLLVIGGPLNQSDARIDRYLDMTKKLYKELLTVYKDSDTHQIKAVNKVYLVHSVEGGCLHSTENELNTFIVDIDPVKKTVTLLKMTFKSFW